MANEEEQLKKRFLEQAFTAFHKNIPVFTDFLNLNEQHLLLSVKKDFPDISFSMQGGFEFSERKMASFYPKYEMEEPLFPICVLQISPLNKKFADKLSHRDYLGAILNLGIDRGITGDILIKEDKAFLFCKEKIAPFIIENLVKIKHTHVSCETANEDSYLIKPELKEIKGSVASVRLDAVLSLAFSESRNNVSKYISGGKVFVNSRLIESNSHMLHEKDVVSVRGLGKFIYKEVLNQTKKGRYYITIQKYI
jgi:RNA-binding protein YlmH